MRLFHLGRPAGHVATQRRVAEVVELMFPILLRHPDDSLPRGPRPDAASSDVYRDGDIVRVAAPEEVVVPSLHGGQERRRLAVSQAY